MLNKLLSLLYGIADFVISSIIWMMLSICLLIIMFVAALPIILSAQYSVWWLMGYVGYVVVLYFIHKLSVE